ncbi:MAG TPA: hypothetical protein VFB38_19010 [Chthonomonadaceae bacterium]|nr:hypothetical protein [Chthonomonadaceae bacterium]
MERGRGWAAAWVLCWLALWLLGLGGWAAAGERPARRVVVVLLPGLRADDLTRPEVPTLRRLIAEGASGWMVSRAARVTDTRLLRPDGRDTTASLLLTLNSGSRAIALPETVPLVPAPDAAQPGASALPASTLKVLQAANQRLDHPVPLGAMGDLFHRVSLRTAAIGNADAGQPLPAAFLLAMDSAGRVDSAGDRLDRNAEDVAAPYGFRADTRAMLADYARLEAQAGLIVLAFGDLARADRYAPLCLPPRAAAHRAAALRALEALLAPLCAHLQQERIASGVERQTRLFVLAPGPAESVTDPRDRLAPVILWGDGVASGTLTSASTRWPGLVVNTDFLASAADFLGQPLPPGATGRPLLSQPSPPDKPPTPAALRAAYAAFLQTANLQYFLGGLPTVQMLLVLAGLASLFWRKAPRLVPATALAIVSLPLGMLVLPPISPGSLWGASALLAAFTLALAGLGALPPEAERRAPRLFYLLCAALVLILLADLLTGSALLRRAWMSYSVMEGQRFYGIGNEYMGTAIGAACVLLGDMEQRAESRGKGAMPYPILYFLLLALLVVMGLPSFGAKVGAIPSTGAAFGVALLVRWRGEVRGRDLLLLLAAAVLLLGAFAAWDLHHAAGEQSHLARAFSGAGGGSLVGIARRKLALEGYLLLHSPWSATLAVSAFGLGWLRRTHPCLFGVGNAPGSHAARAAFAGLVAGAIASLLCNDSGVTAAALVLLYGWAWAVVRLRPIRA